MAFHPHVAVLARATPIAPGRLAPYAAAGSLPVAVERERLEAMGVEVVEADLLADAGLIRHESEKLARAVLDLVPRPRPC